MPPTDHMTDLEILDRMEELIRPLYELGERVARVETRLESVESDQDKVETRMTETEKGQVATRLRIAYIAGAAAVGTAVASWALDRGIAVAMGSG